MTLYLKKIYQNSMFRSVKEPIKNKIALQLNSFLVTFER